MKLRGRKFFAFIMLFAVFTAVIFLILIRSPEAKDLLPNLFFMEIVNAALFIGGNSVDKIFVAKNYIPELKEKKDV